MSDSSRPHGLQPTRLLHPWDFPGKSTGVGCQCLLQSTQQTILFGIQESSISQPTVLQSMGSQGVGHNWMTEWRRQWHSTPALLPGKSHGQRSLVGCSPWGREESDMTERLHFHFSLSCIGEGNGNPLQYSCLENPRDNGA